jgi:protein-S-isoprenylcysteine O-methyltransferase Ste14
VTKAKLNIRAKNIASFYMTVAIPLFYFFCLYSIVRFPNTIYLPIALVLVGVFISFAGLALWVISLIQLGDSFGVLPLKQLRITKGLYKYLKHPMYVGIVMTFLGLGVANRSMQGLLVTLIFLIPLLTIRAKIEESKLIS